MRNPLRSRTSSNNLSSLRRSISFLPPGVNARYRLEHPGSADTLKPFAQEFERSVITPLLRPAPLVDIKGGGANEALFSVSGSILPAEEEERLPLTFRISTTFYDFAEKDHIRFSVREYYDPPLENAGERFQLFLRPDLEVERVAASIEFFKSTIVTRMTGFGPVAAERLTLEASADALRVEISADGLESIQTLPLTHREVLEALDKIVSVRYGYSILADYKHHQEELK